MLPVAARRVLLVATAVVLSACGEPSRPSSGTPSPLEPSLARIPSQCNTGDLASAARSYFSSPEQQTVADTLRAMEDECAGNNIAGVVAGGWTVLSTIEAVLGGGTGGTATDGATLANGVMAFMCGVQGGLCTPMPAPVSADALGPQGIFAVRNADATPIVAHGAVPFTDFGGNSNNALWGLETSTSWASATRVPMILFYGTPDAATSIPVKDLSFGDLGFAMHTFPDVPGFRDGELHVGVCYQEPVELPIPGLADRLQREGTLLQSYTPGCGAWWAGMTQVAGLDRAFSNLLHLVGRAVLPQPLFAATRPPSTGGTPIEFSHFAPVAANPSGSLVFVVPPQDGAAGQPLSPIKVQALSGAGTPIELVEIQLYVAGNQGEPAGATFCDPEGTGNQSCEDTAYTIEALSGYGTLAEFDQATLYKAGGYTICAKALDSSGSTDFTFQGVCAPMIHIKN
jgi:hypothetical protein